MNKRYFGSTNVTVSELGLGTCFMARQGQENVNFCVSHSIDQGITYFDTAADYGKGNDEKMLGIALNGRRNQTFLATKVGGIEEMGGHRCVESIMRQFEAGLDRLKTDHVDLIQIHESDQRKWWSDDPVSIETGKSHQGTLIQDEEDYEFTEAPCVQFLQQAKQEGKTRFVGITGKDARRLARIVRAIDVDGMMVAHQFNPILRNALHFLLPLTNKKGIGVAGGALLLKGWLAEPKFEWRKYPPPWMDPIFQRAYVSYLDIQQDSGINFPELTLRWLLSEIRIHSFVVGFSQWDQIKSNLEAINSGPLPGDLQCAINAIGIVHPLIYQNRNSL